ncbi:RNA polymerase sigma factor YlaC [Anaerohalosphaera lusitana]|uniref:RNA polymerase sigma factor YlaC n=1 Tax=Anaerohalosphaera lusitana TaxID=1936003 RepID=A0A1U9NMW6_9BACT|nr:RNA polymerase sigma factor [Anaerohalosphaera lusitana]AQT69261.1 RNA polymerase sigma factor YlaC [Anaerohalosphaera lusitana]
MRTLQQKREYVGVIDKARNGDQHAMEQLIEMIRRRVWPFIYKRVRHEDIAADLMQETYLAVLRKLPELDNTRGFWQWVFTIARSKIIDHIRRRNVRDLTWFSAIDSAQLEDLMSDKYISPASDMAFDEFMLAFQQARSRLHGRARRIFTMRMDLHMTYEDIADDLGCTIPAARVAFMRARKQIAEELTHNCGYGPCEKFF